MCDPDDKPLSIARPDATHRRVRRGTRSDSIIKAAKFVAAVRIVRLDQMTALAFPTRLRFSLTHPVPAALHPLANGSSLVSHIPAFDFNRPMMLDSKLGSIIYKPVSKLRYRSSSVAKTR